MRTQAVIDLNRIRHNVKTLRTRAASGARLMAVVKADGYGHGAVPVARAAVEAGAGWLGVATVSEGAELRGAGLDVPILILGPMEPADAPAAIAHHLTSTLFGRDLADALAHAARAAGTTARIHLKTDTGMGRLGLHPRDVLAFLEGPGSSTGLEVQGLYSHFATADQPDLAFPRKQLHRFQAVLATLDNRGLRPSLVHMANTAATLALPHSHFDLVRTGIGLYGLPPSPSLSGAADLKPALTWTARIGHLKDVSPGTPLSYGCTHVTEGSRRVATLSVGYGDGYPRLLSNRGDVVVAGRRAPIVGRVCMDLTLVDVTGISGVVVGDPATLVGSDGDAAVTADDLAGWTDTINYEITCQIGRRVPRRYRRHRDGTGV